MRINPWRLVPALFLVALYALAWPWALVNWFSWQPADAFLLAYVGGPLIAAALVVAVGVICLVLGGIALGGAWAVGTYSERLRRWEENR